MSSGSDVQFPNYLWSAVPCTCDSATGCTCRPHTDALVVARELVTGDFLAHRETIYRYVIHQGCTPADAEDLTQEAFLRLYRARLKGHQFDGQSVLPWVLAVARHLAIDRYRRLRFERPLFQELSANLAETLPDEGQDGGQLLEERQRRAALMRAVQELTPLQRECLHLRSQGLTLRAVGAIVGVPFRGVSRAVQRAIKRLRHHIDDLA